MLIQREKNKDPRVCAAKKTSIGGQALIEGIMMRGPAVTAMAVRNPAGEIVLEKDAAQRKKPPKILRLPLIRGIYGMITSFTTGYKYLMRSAEIAGLDDDGSGEKKTPVIPQKEETGENAAVNPTGIGETTPFSADKPADTPANGPETSTAAVEIEDPAKSEENERSGEERSSGGIPKALLNVVMVVGSVLGVILAVVLFISLPRLLFKWLINDLFGVKAPGDSASYGQRYLYQVAISAFTGVLKIAIFVGYMALVSLMKDIKRTFMYHGAEHKTIFCYEQGLPLTVENIRAQRRFHPRCGTSFMIVMLLISIIIGTFIPNFAEYNYLLYTLVKILLVPLAVGIGYEFIKFAGRHDGVIVRILSAPGLWMQRISTKEPTDDMIECAIAAMNEVIPADGSDNW